MCGIFGLVTKDKAEMGLDKLKSWSDCLFELSESRGKEASGIAILRGRQMLVYKRPIRGTLLIKDESYKNLFKKTDSPGNFYAFVGHSRLATNGFQADNRNNQPVFDRNGVIIHNGIVVNDEDIWSNFLKEKPRYEVDTEVILRLLGLYSKKGYSLTDVAKKTFSTIKGSASIAYLPSDEQFLLLATNTGSIYYVANKNPRFLVFASESYILKKFLGSQDLNFLENKITHLKAGFGLKVDIKDISSEVFNLGEVVRERVYNTTKNRNFSVRQKKGNSLAEKDFSVTSGVRNYLSKLKKHDFDYGRISKLQRCTKCILPSTMPLITFDDKGICNYCKNHRKITYKGVKALHKLVKPFKSKNGEADCLVAFSGGRDSSYGLHFIKKELGMNPIAYTYDWGMVTDLARRNQARMVGKLGIEHIIVSADISYKRNNIRKNILAWLKKPDLGMVPLFMAGDKQAEYYADQVAKHSGVKLIFYCRGNELENEEFKWGYCGIKDGSPGGILHNLSLGGKIKIASYYGRQFVTNPSYLNSSVFDTAFAYFSAYIKMHNYIYLWHYIPWNEDKIVSTLKSVYGWETDPNNNLTWRTDDGTPAFYNYIFYHVQGFTENDTFKSNQIREGVLTRKKALELVQVENKPRYEALKWYFDRVGLDGHKILSSIDKIPRTY